MGTVTMSLEDYENIRSENSNLKKRIDELDKIKVVTYRSESVFGGYNYLETKDEAINYLVNTINKYKDEVRDCEKKIKDYRGKYMDAKKISYLLEEVKQMSLLEFLRYKRHIKRR